MKVKNVIKGHLTHEDIERIVIINPNSDGIAIYSGPLEKYLNPDPSLEPYKQNVDDMEVLKSAVNCGCQLFIIVK